MQQNFQRGKNSTHHLISAAIMSVPLYLLVYNFGFMPERWYHLVLYAGLGLGIYLTIMYLLKEFTKDDFNLVKNTIDINKMYTYIKNEISGRE